MDLRTQDSSSALAYDYGQQSLGSKNEAQGSDIHEIHEALTPPSVPHSQEKAWQTGFLRNVPWLGLGALLLVLCSIIASTAILVISNGDAVSTWRIAPSVILALLTSLSTACFGLALASGINVTWWRRMLQGGNLDDIHYYWEQGSSLWAAATAGRRSSLLSISKLFIAVAAIAEGPLLQRATTIAAREVSRPFSLQAALAVNLFPVTTAQLLEESTIPNYPTSNFTGAYNNYTNRVPITYGFDGCPGVCTADAPGVGFSVSCGYTNTTWNTNGWGAANLTHPQFDVDTSWNVQYPENFQPADQPAWPQPITHEYLTLSAGWAENTANPLTYTSRVCNLSLAVVSYPLQITNSTVSLNLPAGTNPEVLYDLPFANSNYEGFGGAATLGGFYMIGTQNFFANVSLQVQGAFFPYGLEGLNPFAWAHLVDPTWDGELTDYVWRDPVPDVLAAYHEIMFRLGLNAATNATLVPPVELGGQNVTSVNNVPAVYMFSENYYVTRYEYLAGAIAVVIIALLSVVPT